VDTNVIGTGARPAGDDDMLRVFQSADAPADPAGIASLSAGTLGADLAAPAVVLPDFHHKSNMEMPSSIAVATRETIRPALSSSSLNCGMALIALDMERPSEASIETFFDLVKQRYPYPRKHRVDLSADDVLRCAVEGSSFAVERFGLDPADIDRVEHAGRLDVERYGGAARARRELPWLVVQMSRMRFGTIGPSNHFVELQQVEEILDPAAARRLGVQLGQITLQYHGGGGVLTTEIGALFGTRKGAPKPLRAQMLVQRPLFHLRGARSAAEFGLRRSLYMMGRAPVVPRWSAEGSRLMLANTMAMNYGFAFRLSTYATFLRFAAQAFGARGGRLVVDSPHNSIYEEEVDHEPAIVHRHNSCRALPPAEMRGHPAFGETGQPVLLPGTNRTSSYLCVADEGVRSSLHSTCHGSGETVRRFAEQGRSDHDPQGRSTLRFRYSGTAPERVGHLDDRGVDHALHILSANRLVRPIARVRPIAVLT
jgi:tRNA-splicing ligase RtcB